MKLVAGISFIILNPIVSITSSKPWQVVPGISPHLWRPLVGWTVTVGVRGGRTNLLHHWWTTTNYTRAHRPARMIFRMFTREALLMLRSPHFLVVEPTEENKAINFSSFAIQKLLLWYVKSAKKKLRNSTWSYFLCSLPEGRTAHNVSWNTNKSVSP